MKNTIANDTIFNAPILYNPLQISLQEYNL